MITLKQYKEKKEKGLAAVAKIGNAFAMSVKKFSPDDGLEIDPEITALSLNQLEGQKAGLEADIQDIDYLIADLKAL